MGRRGRGVGQGDERAARAARRGCEGGGDEGGGDADWGYGAGVDGAVGHRGGCGVSGAVRCGAVWCGSINSTILNRDDYEQIPSHMVILFSFSSVARVSFLPYTLSPPRHTIIPSHFIHPSPHYVPPSPNSSHPSSPIVPPRSSAPHPLAERFEPCGRVSGER